MSVKNCEKVETNKVALTIEVEAAAFEAAIEKAYRKARNQINIPGFRKGKAPRKMIESMYGAEVFYEEAINIAMPEAYLAAVSEKELEPVGYPEIDLGEVSKDGFTFTAKVFVYPEVKLGQYKGIEAVKAEAKATPTEVNKRIEAMAQRNSRLVTVDRAVENGDTANIDFEGFDNGVPFAGGKGEGFDLEIGSGSFVPGFEEQLIGMTAGEEKDIDITFPENYHADLAGKAVVFHVKVNTVQVKEVPAIDDEFAKDVSEFDTLAELKKDVKAKMIEERQEAIDREFEDTVMQMVADNLECEIPQPMIDDQANRFVNDLKMRIQQQGIPFEQYLKMTNMTEADVVAQAQEPALRQVKMGLAMEAIAKEENLTVTDEEVEADYQNAAEKYGMKAEDLKKYIDAETIRSQLMDRKVIELVMASAVALKPEKKKKAAKTEEASETAEAGEDAE